MARIDEAFAAQQVLGEDFFGGWKAEDVALLARHARQTEPQADMITDFLGTRTQAALFPHAAVLHGTAIDALPIPDDSLRAEAIEYFALLTSLEAANAHRFVMVELGAAYAPWACVAAVLAERSGRNWRVVTVEASKGLHDLIPGHLQSNGINPADPRVHMIHGAIADARAILRFPKATSTDELGGQVSKGDEAVDYLGRTVEYENVQAYTLADVLPDGIVDLVHVDIQGFEHIVLSSAIDVLNERVKAVFIGIHSRKIEGQLIETLHANGWRLIRERPTKFEYRENLADPVAWTTRDGGQYWTNPRLV